jgi:hypothetical protein
MGISEDNNMGFRVKDCTLITRMAGVKEAMNLRELEERLRVCPDECLFHHFCETVIRPTFDYPDYTNDFALWAGKQLLDKILAERLSVLNPYKCKSFNELRQQVLDIVEERLSEIENIPWAPKGQAFQFLQAATVVFDTGIVLSRPYDFYKHLPNMSLGSIYYHFVEARRRTKGMVDDFTAWLIEFGNEVSPLIKTLSEIDFYFLSLPELKNTLVAITTKFLRDAKHEKNINQL